jgi:hypothetical protein
VPGSFSRTHLNWLERDAENTSLTCTKLRIPWTFMPIPSAYHHSTGVGQTLLSLLKVQPFPKLQQGSLTFFVSGTRRRL